ncbi:MAG: aconitate hydratase AcnA [Candidatus Thermoplasmatota archaeon]|nr:aconitate hydratase AcnA [Candidatus Thermoplasmatota archaeon]
MSSKFQKISVLKAGGKEYKFYSLKELEKDGHKISRLPYPVRIILESLIRNFDGKTVTESDVENLLNWNAAKPSDSEIPFKVARVVMQDFTGVPAVVDLAAMRDAAQAAGKNPEVINPQVPVDLVIDHSVQVDFYGEPNALQENVDMEFQRNGERYRFLKWAQNAFHNMRIVPPSVGIIHQVNLEYLAKVVMTRKSGNGLWAYPDTLVGTDSHTTMIDGLGVVGWGVGGIEAEAAMLDQPVTFKTPEVIGVKLTGKLRPGVTSTDMVLTITELLRKNKVVDKFLEFFGEGIKSLTIPDRATISNMCPEYGATVAMFPVDEQTIEYLKLTGRDDDQVDLIEKYFKAQGLFGTQNDVEYSRVIELDLGTVKPSVSGPSLPQQRTDLGRIGDNFLAFMEQSGSVMETGSRSQKQVVLKSAPVKINGRDETLTEGDVVIAAITSCTNTSNPYVMLGAGLLAKKAVQKGLRVNPKVKTSLAPGSRVVSEYLKKAGLQEYLDKLGFELVGFGCTTCIGNSGPLNESIEHAIVSENMSTAAVLSGNRNFEARIHRNVKANYLMSPPLVVAFALAGKVTIDMDNEPLGLGSDGKPVFLKDIWPTSDEILSAMKGSISREMFVEKYRNLDEYNPKWKAMEAPSGKTYAWDEKSTYIRKPPFFDNFNPETEIEYSEILDARPLLVLGDSVTTDHISPAGSFSKDTPAGKYLVERGVSPADFNSYGSRRGNHEVMMRGTFANNRIKNLMVKKEGGFSVHFPDGKEGSVFDVAMQYMKEKIPEIVLAGDQYGTGSSRDWAAKGPFLLGVKAVVATGYERIHRSNLVGMGIVPLQFRQGETYASLKVDFSKPMDVIFDHGIKPLGKATFRYYSTGSNDKKSTEVTLRVDTPVEAEYLASGGILQFVLGKILRAN